MQHHFVRRRPTSRAAAFALAAGLIATAAACASGPATVASAPDAGMNTAPAIPIEQAMRSKPDPDPRVGLGAGLMDAEQAVWNLEVLSTTPPPPEFIGVTNSDLAFKDDYAFQGNYNGYQVWDISDPREPSLVVGYVCPASQSDVSVYENLLFVSGEGLSGRIDCGTEGVSEAVSGDRLRGVRIFDISDLRNPVNVGNVQTCRGSHTHSLLVDPDDPDNVYVYISGSAGVRPEEELPGCVSAPPSEDPNSALFRIEVIRVPLDRPQDAEIVSSPRIFEDLVAPPQHGLSPADLEEIERMRAQGAFIVEIGGTPRVLPDRMIAPMLDSLVAERGGSGAPTAADSARLREALPQIMAQRMGPQPRQQEGPRPGPTQCHDITLYPAIDLAGGACGGYGLLLDISDPANPVRVDEVADENFSYWHSATFNNSGTKVLFSDEWGGGGQPKCREKDPMEWGADAIFTLENRRMEFQSYFKMPAPQTPEENCVAHNGSLIPIPGRDVMVQAWYQGGISVFDWTDPRNPVEIAFFDRGPVNAEQMESAGSWSVYWYNGALYSSEIARGLDVFALTPSEFLTQNEIDAANSVRLEYFNPQGQPKFEWPATFALARAYADQLQRSGGLAANRIASVRETLAEAEDANGNRAELLTGLADELSSDATGSSDRQKVEMLVDAVRRLASS